MHFRLLELPVELRLCIYRALIEDSDRRLDVKSSETSESRAEKGTIGFYTCSRKLQLFGNLIFTNKQIFQETRPMLYESYSFVFQDVWSLQAFLRQTGPSIRHIRSIDILETNGRESTCRALGEVMIALNGATSLTKLNVDATSRGMIPRLSANQLIRILRPLLNRFHSMGVRFRTKQTKLPQTSAEDASLIERVYDAPMLYHSVQLLPSVANTFIM